MKTIVHPSCFPSITQFAVMVQADELIYEAEDNFQKQTYRNRYYIYAANGKLLLSIPVKHTKSARKKYRDIQIDDSFHWQKLHWKTLQTAYRTSPFFEYFEDELIPLFEKKYSFLYDFNLETISFINNCLQHEISSQKTNKYEKEIKDGCDARPLINAKKEVVFQMDHYTQVFSQKYGFIKNLSVLDLLFNEGGNAITYLENQHIHL